MQLRVALPILALALPPLASAQCFNIDFGPAAQGVPGSSYGAAARQPGAWNAIHLGADQPLAGLAGQPTSARISAFATAVIGEATAAQGDDRALLRDVLSTSTKHDYVTVVLSGLAPGSYLVYSYVNQPATAYPDCTLVGIAGSPDAEQGVAGEWPGEHRLEITFAVHRVAIGGAPLSIDYFPCGDKTQLAGLQIVQLGAPSHAAYCSGATTTGGCHPRLEAAGAPSASFASAFWLFGVSAPKPLFSAPPPDGIFLYGIAGRSSIPFAPGSTSTLCVASPLQRVALEGASSNFGTACSGWLAVDWNRFVSTHPTALGAPFSGGQLVDAQLWVRDDAAPRGGNLTDALEFTTGP